MLRNALLLIAATATPALASDGLVETGCGLGGTESILAFGLVFFTLLRPLHRRG